MAFYLKVISLITATSFSSYVSVFEEVLEITSRWKKSPGISVEFKLCWSYPLMSFL